MSVLLGPNGKPITTTPRHYKKADPPRALGEAFGGWGGNRALGQAFPGGSVLQFNLNNLNLGDYRNMRDHYQVNISLSVLTFVMHQIDWHIECDNQKIADFCETNMRLIWSQLVRGMAQSFWAGFSPMILQFENDSPTSSVQLTKIKDLVPEDCIPHWRYVDGWVDPRQGMNKVPPKIPIYDGINNIRYRGGYGELSSLLNRTVADIPVENTLWYPLMMENGDYFGRKLLRAAFTPWFFSNLIHLFSNRYFERFGEPMPVGRAPYDDVVNLDGVAVPGNQAMLTMLENLRARNVVVLPNDKSGPTDGSAGSSTYDYAIEYLESQMRGADFERYLTRLDEEITLALFTPLLVTRTADVGSYNLGSAHQLTYNMMLNAMAGDWKQHIDPYVLDRMVDFNFGVNAPRAKIKFRKLGRAEQETLRTLMSALVQAGAVKIDMQDLGEMVGMDLKAVEVVTQPPADPTNPPAEKPVADVKKAVKARIAQQAANRFSKNGTGGRFDMGFRRRMEDAVRESGITNPVTKVTKVYNQMEHWLEDVSEVPFETAEQFCESFDRTFDYELEGIGAN